MSHPTTINPTAAAAPTAQPAIAPANATLKSGDDQVLEAYRLITQRLKKLDDDYARSKSKPQRTLLFGLRTGA